MHDSKSHGGEEEMYMRSLIVTVLQAFDASFINHNFLKKRTHKPPPPRIYSMAALTFPPVAWRARTFCEALMKPIAFNC